MIGFLRTHKMLAAIVAALIQCGVLGYMIQSRALILRSGTEVVLKTEPVDPRDLLRGDYVTLSYEISSFSEAETAGGLSSDLDESALVYVALKKGADGSWGKSRVSGAPFTDLKTDEVLIRGRAYNSFTRGSTGALWLKYGIERFYVPEGEGRPIEEGIGEKRIETVIMVSPAGKAQIKALRDGGKALYEEPLY